MRLALLEGAGKVLDLLHRLDTNGDRTVSKSEFRHSLPLMGFDASQTEVIDAVFDELDEDGSGTIEFEEFLVIMARRIITTQGEMELEQALLLFKPDESGRVPCVDIRTMLGLSLIHI